MNKKKAPRKVLCILRAFPQIKMTATLVIRFLFTSKDALKEH